MRWSHLGGAGWLLPYKQLASSRDEIWAKRLQGGYHTYSTGATQFGTAHSSPIRVVCMKF